MTKIRAELNSIEIKETILRINESRSWFFEKINKTDKFLSIFIEKKRERTQINTIRNEREEIQLTPQKYEGLLRNYYEELYAKKCKNLDEMDKSVEK